MSIVFLFDENPDVDEFLVQAVQSLRSVQIVQAVEKNPESI